MNVDEVFGGAVDPFGFIEGREGSGNSLSGGLVAGGAGSGFIVEGFPQLHDCWVDDGGFFRHFLRSGWNWFWSGRLGLVFGGL